MMDRALGVLPWLAGALACLPLLTGGFPQGHDWTYELVRVAEYGAAVAVGQLPPYWAENLYGGYGSPVFLFYAPLFSAAAALLGALTGSVASGATLLLVALTAVSVWATLGFLRAATELAGVPSAAAARVGTSFYVLSPYLLGDKLLRNADAEFAAFCFAPLALWGLMRARSQPRAAVALVAAGLGLTILSHNLTALVLVTLLIGGAVAVYLAGRSVLPVQIAGGGVLLGLAGTAFFWLPAVSYTHLIRTQQLLIGKFDFHGQFPALLDALGYGQFYSAGLLGSVVLVAGLYVAVTWRGPAIGRRLLIGLLLAAASCGFLLLRASTFVWELIPGLPLFQFPWRMLGPLALLAAPTAALCAAHFGAGLMPRARVLVEVGAVALCALNAWPTLAQYRPLPGSSVQVARMLEPEQIRSSGQSVTVLDEYIPTEALPDLWRREPAGDGPVQVVGGGVSVELISATGSQVELRASSAEGGWLRFTRWYWLGWKAEIDGEPIRPRRSFLGAVELAIPAGEHRALLWLSPPPLRLGGLAVSALALIVGAVVLPRVPRRGEGEPAQ